MLTIHDVTRRPARLACTVGFLVFSIAGCGDLGGDGDGGAGATGGVGGTPGIGGTPGMGGTGGSDPATLFATATDAQNFGELGGPPLEGVEVCESDTDNCATTNENGKATIELPGNREVSYTLSKDGYRSRLHADVTDKALYDVPAPMYSDAVLAEFVEINMIPSPWTGGALILLTLPRRAGVTFDLVDATAQAYFLDAAGTPTLELTATSTNGRGGFVEVPAGEYQVEFGGTVTDCVADLGWPGDAANRIKLPVKTGYITIATMGCDPL